MLFGVSGLLWLTYYSITVLFNVFVVVTLTHIIVILGILSRPSYILDILGILVILISHP